MSRIQYTLWQHGVSQVLGQHSCFGLDGCSLYGPHSLQRVCPLSAVSFKCYMLLESPSSWGHNWGLSFTSTVPHTALWGNATLLLILLKSLWKPLWFFHFVSIIQTMSRASTKANYLTLSYSSLRASWQLKIRKQIQMFRHCWMHMTLMNSLPRRFPRKFLKQVYIGRSLELIG